MAKDIMRSPVVTANRDQTVSEAAEILIENQIGSVVVVNENGDFCGLMSEEMIMPREHASPFMHGSVTRIMGLNADEDLAPAFRQELVEVGGKTIDEVMNSAPPTAAPDATIDEVINLIEHTGGHHLPIIENGKPVGIIARHDLMRLFAA